MTMAITIKSHEEIAILREGGKRLAEILDAIVAAARPGVSTYDLDILGEHLMREAGGVPSFKGYKIKDARASYPCSICVSINNEVVHAIPRRAVLLKKGDVVGIYV